MTEPARPVELETLPMPRAGDGRALLEVVSCGLCHTDVSFLYGGVRPRKPLPLTLGHEILGVVLEADRRTDLVGRRVVVPAVLPCGECELCRAGRGNICRRQKMPGNDFDGGFASHVLVPERYLVPVPAALAENSAIAVVADAVSTAYQAVERADVDPSRMVVVVGAGGVGTFAIQCARRRGATVVAIDISPERLEDVAAWTAGGLDASELTRRDIRSAVEEHERDAGLAPHGRVVLECSGSAAGQETAFGLLTYDGTLMVVGYTREKIPLRLSNLMAFDARAVGNWGCLPEHYPRLLDLVASGDLELEPFVEEQPMSRLNELMVRHDGRRPVLTPDF
ncbi:MAG: 6-hydroxycyclohex-1-ene-1-carbonyl-CoA dehydrogenase [Thermoanaerobaculia bacterium]|nr:6-hydroxycyclohex-1-ene-1-carbonyl-CoA dehydrogenase [Thermoanaerobaculia bacterium]